MEKDEIIIRSAILHILDSTIGMPVLSERLLELSPDLNDFLRTHIYKIAASDDTKDCRFLEVSKLGRLLENFTEEALLQTSCIIAEALYTIMNQNIAILPADLLVVTYQLNSCMYLALLKMNYKDSYIHYIDSNEEGNATEIVKQKATLPPHSTKLTEAALIRLTDGSIRLAEKKVEVNGVKTNYFSELFLQCQTELSSKAKLNIVTKAVEQMNQKYYENDLEKQLETKSILHKEYTEQGAIQLEAVCEKLFSDVPEIKEEFTEKLEKYNLKTEEVKPQNKQTMRKFEKQFLKTDSGIEINIPMELYNNKQNIEFINNPDGTISVLIKNINHIVSK